MNISVIGSGGWGTALALHLDKCGHKVFLWSYLPEESERLKNDRENKEFLPGVSFGEADLSFTSDIDEAAALGGHRQRRTQQGGQRHCGKAGQKCRRKNYS